MTKGVLLLFIALSFFVGEINAQTKFVPEWNIGAGFGPTFSTVDFVTFRSPGVDTKNTMQYHGGVAVRYIAEKNVGIIAEVNWSQQGWEGKYKDNPEFKHKHSLTYLEVPVLTHIYFGNKVRFVVNLGPKVQYLLSENEELSDELQKSIASGNSGLVTLQYNRKIENKFDYGIIAGMGMEFRTGIGNFALEGRYYFGLGDIYDNKKNDYNFSRSANRVISAKLTYYVKLF